MEFTLVGSFTHDFASLLLFNIQFRHIIIQFRHIKSRVVRLFFLGSEDSGIGIRFRFIPAGDERFGHGFRAGNGPVLKSVYV